MKKVIIIAIAVLVGISFVGISTAAAQCENPPGIGTGSPGYWKKHPDAWPVEEIEVGGFTYTKEAAIFLMKHPVKRDKTYTLFKAFVAAKLNVLIGNCPPPKWCWDDAVWWLTEFPVGSGVRAREEAWQHSHGEAIYWCLDAYNNGWEDGIPSRDDLE